MAFSGSVDLNDGLRPRNDGSFPLVHAKDVYVDDENRLDAKLNGIEAISQASVRVDIDQTFSDTQKALARSNIGAVELAADLTETGKAADAKVVGDEITGLKEDLSEQRSILHNLATCIAISTHKTVLTFNRNVLRTELNEITGHELSVHFYGYVASQYSNKNNSYISVDLESNTITDALSYDAIRYVILYYEDGEYKLELYPKGVYDKDCWYAVLAVVYGTNPPAINTNNLQLTEFRLITSFNGVVQSDTTKNLLDIYNVEDYKEILDREFIAINYNQPGMLKYNYDSSTNTYSITWQRTGSNIYGLVKDVITKINKPSTIPTSISKTATSTTGFIYITASENAISIKEKSEILDDDGIIAIAFESYLNPLKNNGLFDESYNIHEQWNVWKRLGIVNRSASIVDGTVNYDTINNKLITTRICVVYGVMGEFAFIDPAEVDLTLLPEPSNIIYVFYNTSTSQIVAYNKPQIYKLTTSEFITLYHLLDIYKGAYVWTSGINDDRLLINGVNHLQEKLPNAGMNKILHNLATCIAISTHKTVLTFNRNVLRTELNEITGHELSVHFYGYVASQYSNKNNSYISVDLESNTITDALSYDAIRYVILYYEDGEYKLELYPKGVYDKDCWYAVLAVVYGTNPPAINTNNLQLTEFRLITSFNGVVQSDTTKNLLELNSVGKEATLSQSESYKIFSKVGVIGDSLSVGYMYNVKTGEARNRDLRYAWGKYVSRDAGVPWIHFGTGGQNVLTWASNTTYGKVQMEASGNKCQAYIIGLGVNDSSDSPRGCPLGTASDVSTDPDTVATTYYGGYARIIQLIKRVNADAKIFCLTNPMANTVGETYNDAIRYIAETYYTKADNVYLIDQYRDYKHYFDDSDGLIYKDKAAIHSHYSPIGYQAIAQLNEIAISKVIDDNIAQFIGVPYIDFDEGYGTENVY